MPLPLPSSSPSLVNVLAARSSAHTFDASGSISLEQIGTLLGYALRERESGGRPYPSGGGLYPIETYVIARLAGRKQRIACHYDPQAHALEELWPVADEIRFFSTRGEHAWVESASLIVVFTSIWTRSSTKYGDFSYILGMLEAGHMAQNVLLLATALDLDSCPLEGFSDDAIIQNLDINTTVEQPVYVLAIG